MSEEVTIVESYDLGFATIEVRSDGIITTTHPDVDTVNVAQLSEMVELLEKLAGGTPKLFYADNTNLKSLGYPEREYIGKNLHRFAKASGVKENSSVVRFIGHTINHMFPPKVPMQMFNTKKECIEWLKSL